MQLVPNDDYIVRIKVRVLNPVRQASAPTRP
jgi:hypothetical protein